MNGKGRFQHMLYASNLRYIVIIVFDGSNRTRKWRVDVWEDSIELVTRQQQFIKKIGYCSNV